MFSFPSDLFEGDRGRTDIEGPIRYENRPCDSASLSGIVGAYGVVELTSNLFLQRRTAPLQLREPVA